MLKKNMRKRLLAGALATIMALTMCPTWALAVDEGTNLPAPPVVDSTPTGDTIQTPDAGTQRQTEPKDTEQAGQLENQDTEQAPSGGTDIEETGNNSSSNENDSQNNDAVSNSPANEIAPTSGNSTNEVDVYAMNQQITAECWITNQPVTNSEGAWQTKTISASNVADNDEGTAVTEIATDTITKNSEEAYVFWQARVHASNEKQTERGGDDKTAKGTEITNIRYNDGQLEYQPKDSSKWTAFAEGSQLVFYYLIRTKYSQMVQIDVSDWTVNAEPNWKQYPERRSVTYQVIIKDGPEAGTRLSGKTFWYNSAVNVSAVRVRQTETADYKIDSVVLAPKGLGTVKNVNGEHQFGLKLSKTQRNATVNIYVSATSHNLTYYANGGTLADGSYSKDKIYPKIELKLPTNAEITRKGYTFDGWYDENNKPYQTGDLMPNADLTLYAKWTPKAYKVIYQNEDETTYAEEPHNVDSSVTVKTVDATHPEKVGYTFTGWTTTDATVGEDGKFTMPEHDVIFTPNYKKNPAPEYKYTINQHFYDANGVEIDHMVPPTNGTAVKGTSIETLYANYAKNQQNYVYVPSMTTITPASQDGRLVEAVTIDLHYYLDTKGGANPDEDGNNIPDAWEIRLTFQVKNGKWNDETTDNVVVYVSNKDANGNAIAKSEDGTVTFAESIIPLAGEQPNTGFKAGAWDKGLPTNTKVANDTVFTYTYAPVSKYPYAIEHHKYDPAAKAYVLAETENDFAVLDKEITAKPKSYDDYVLNPYAKYYLERGKVFAPVTDENGNVTKLTLKLFYDPDIKGNSEDPENKGDGIPDRYQYKVTEKVVNGKWDSHTKDNKDIIFYVSTINMGTGKTVQPKLAAADIAQAGNSPDAGYRAAGSWNVEPKVDMEIKADTIFTYTYAEKSSSGGGGGGGSRKPTVTIPDDVPTGLNGDDHYAYIVGYPDSTVRPQNGITRAEVATIFFRLLTDETRNANSTKSNSYSDVAAGAWYNHAVSTLSAMGIVKGDSHGKFNPNAPITRAEFAAIAARFDDKANTTAVDFSDIASHWAKNEISAAANNGWINGYTDGTFRPNNKITRAEAMTLVNRVLKRLPETAEDLHNDMIKWSDNSDTSAWYYLAVQEATNSHYYDLKENKHEKWSKLRETRDWTELEK